MINAAVYSAGRSLLTAGITGIFEGHEEIVVRAVYHDEKSLLSHLKQDQVQILFYAMREFSPDLLQRLRTIYLSLRVLVVTPRVTRDTVFRAIKAGANGLVTADVEESELLEAVYTLQNGHDYFGKSITHLLVTDYVQTLRSEHVPRDVDILSKREIEVVTLWGDGLTNKEIADRLFVSTRTVESHKNHIMQKLNLRTSVDLLKFGIRNNLISV